MFAAIRRASSFVSSLAAEPSGFLEPHRHNHQPNNDTDEGKTKHDAIGIEFW
jgi:hypothetical protein